MASIEDILPHLVHPSKDAAFHSGYASMMVIVWAVALTVLTVYLIAKRHPTGEGVGGIFFGGLILGLAWPSVVLILPVGFILFARKIVHGRAIESAPPRDDLRRVDELTRKVRESRSSYQAPS